MELTPCLGVTNVKAKQINDLDFSQIFKISHFCLMLNANSKSLFQTRHEVNSIPELII